MDLGVAPTGATLPLAFSGNWCHLELEGNHASPPFAWEVKRRAAVEGRLSPPYAKLLCAALASSGTTILRTAVECVMAVREQYRLDLPTVQKAMANFLLAVASEGFVETDTTGTQMGNFLGQWSGGGFA